MREEKKAALRTGILVLVTILIGTIAILLVYSHDMKLLEDRMPLEKKLTKVLIRWECGAIPYPDLLIVRHDTKEKLVVGIGHDIVPDDKLELGDEISPHQFYLFWVTDFNACMDAMRSILKNWQSHPVEVQVVISAMCFQLGRHGTMQFKKMLKAIDDRDYGKASREILNSKWARETPKRAKHMSAILVLAIPSASGG